LAANEFRDVAWGGGKFVAVGGRSDYTTTTGKIAHSSDGTSWTAMDLDIVANFSIYGIAYAGTAGNNSPRFHISHR
jgi:hypothetical protein